MFGDDSGKCDYMSFQMGFESKNSWDGEDDLLVTY